MNQTILNRLRQAVKRGLDEKAGQIIESYGNYLSKRDLASLIRYMKQINTYSVGVIRHIFYVSPHRHNFNPIEDYKLLFLTDAYPAIIDLLWSDDRVVQEYKRFEISDDYSICHAHYAARQVLTNGSSRVIRVMIDKIQSPYMLNFALEMAAEKGYTDIVKLLFEQYSYALDEQSCSCSLNTASNRGYDDIVSILLESGAKVSQNTEPGYYYAAVTGR